MILDLVRFLDSTISPNSLIQYIFFVEIRVYITIFLIKVGKFLISQIFSTIFEQVVQNLFAPKFVLFKESLYDTLLIMTLSNFFMHNRHANMHLLILISLCSSSTYQFIGEQFVYRPSEKAIFKVNYFKQNYILLSVCSQKLQSVH